MFFTFHRKKIIWFVFGLLGALAFWYSCANVGFPSGGPKDTTPPVVVSSDPPNSSTNFSGDQIRILFDEYIQLRGLSQKLFISPPLEQNPDIRVRGKSLIINLKEKLRENTTYSFFFGDAIVDFTEGNAIPSFAFVVATGPHVDSLSISGNVVDAFSMEPVEGVLVMLYDNYQDSVPYLEFPTYVALTDKSGNYTINNIREGRFKIFALQDQNSNYKFDMPKEAIAFLDSLVAPVYASAISPTTPYRQAEKPEDGEYNENQERENQLLELEPVLEALEPGFETVIAKEYDLVLFVEADTVQRITSTTSRRGVVGLFFKIPYDSLSLRELSGNLKEPWFFAEPSKTRDTLNLYIVPPLPDSLYFEIADRGVVLDTLKVPPSPRQARTREVAPELPPLEISFNWDRGRSLHYFSPLTISSKSLLEEFDASMISVENLTDSLVVEAIFEIDSIRPWNLRLKTPLENGGKYKLGLLQGALTNVFGSTNDSLSHNFTLTSPEDYSTLVVNLDTGSATAKYIFQLLDKDKKVLVEKLVEGTGAYSFHNLRAANYGLRLIKDLNGNKKWDAGNYLRKIQPEPVYYFKEQIQLRQNWESEITWVVNK